MFGNSAEAVILVNVLYELLAVVLTQGLHVPWDALSYLSSCDEGTEKLKPTIKLKVDDGEIAVLPFIICLF